MEVDWKSGRIDFRDPKWQVKPFFRWYDLWVGVFIDTTNRIVYFCPLPMVGIKVYWD